MRTFFIDKRNIILTVLVVLSLFFISVAPVFADVGGGTSGSGLDGGTTQPGLGGGTSGPVSLDNPLGNIKGFCGFIKALFVAVGTIAVPIAVLFLVFAGFKFVWARGSATGLEEAKKNLFYTILGIAIFFAAWLLAVAIGNTLSSFGVSVIGTC